MSVKVKNWSETKLWVHRRDGAESVCDAAGRGRGRMVKGAVVIRIRLVIAVTF